MAVTVCHMTSVHYAEDIRIFHKECASLAKAGYEVSLVERGDSAEKKGVHIIGYGEAPKGRLKRMTGAARAVYEKARALDCDVYHFHDPELLPYGLKLKKAGKKVIFDSHEDTPAQIMDKAWIPKPARRLISKCYAAYEKKAAKKIDGVVAATPHIAERFKGVAAHLEVVNNFPMLDDILFHETPFEERERIVCYAGGISEIRGEKVMVEAMKDEDAQLVLAGEHETGENGSVKYIGTISRAQVNDLYGKARAGIVIYQPAGNHREAQPIKMFEFMAAGLPVVASDFPLWKRYIEDDRCGICVDPTDAAQVREACMRLIDNPREAQEMGRRGREAVVAKYSWDSEEKKLLALYRQIV